MTAIRRLGAAIGLVAVWLRAAPVAILALAAMVGLSAFLATAAPLWFDRSSEAALSQLLATAPAGGSGLEFEETGHLGATDPHPMAAVDAERQKLLGQVPDTVAGGLAPPITLIDGQDFRAIGAPQTTTYLTPRIEPEMADAIRYYEGAAPTGRVETEQNDIGFGFVDVFEVALSRATAEALLLHVGDRLNMSHVATRGISQSNGYMRVVVVGLFDVVDPGDRRWFNDATLERPSVRRISAEQFDYHAIGLLSPDAYPALVAGSSSATLRYRWRFAMDPNRPAAVGVDAFALDLAKLARAFPFRAGAGVPGVAGLTTGLLPILDRYRSERAIAATVVVLASAGAVVAAAGALGLLVNVLRRRRSGTVRLARARGADLARLVGIALIEAAVVVVPAVVIGWLVAGVVLGGGVAPPSAIAPVVVGLAATLLLVATAIRTSAVSLATGREQSDRTADARNRRRVLDGFVIVTAVAIALGLRGSGSADPAAPLDAARAAAPGLLAIAGAVILLRLFDGLAAGLARISRRRRGFVVVHAVRDLARGPRTHELPLLVLLVTVASGVFAATVSTTIGRTQSLAAATSVGADYRIDPAHPGVLPPSLDLAALRAIGPTAATARDEGTLQGFGGASQSVTVVGIDATAYEAVTTGTQIDGQVPAEFLAARPAAPASPGPIPIVVAPALASDTGLHPGLTLQLGMGGATAPAIVVGVGDPVPAVALGRGILAPLDALREAFPDRALLPTQAYIRAAPTDRPRIEAVLEPYHGGVQLISAADALAGLTALPLSQTMATAFVASELIAAAFAVLVVAASVAQSLTLRSSELTLLRAIGLPGRRAVGIVALELGSTLVVAVAGGLVLGLGTAALVVPGLGIERFVGVAVSAPPSVDPAGLALSIVAPALAALGALLVLGRAGGSASGVTEWIRTAET